MTGNEKVLHALGMCAKARGLVCGVPLICEALKSKGKTVYAVLCADDNAENSAKRLCDRCAYYQKTLVVLPFDGKELSQAIGKSGRIAAVAITDRNLWNLVRQELSRVQTDPLSPCSGTS